MGEIDAEVPAPPPAPPLGIQWEQVDERLKKAVGDLPEAQRTVLLLWAVEGLKYRQIADVTEVAIGTVMSRLFRARQTLGEQLKDLAAEQRLGGGEISVPLQTP
jgi:RNA polymerase sigma-70 factor (ECF subfamily)